MHDEEQHDGTQSRTIEGSLDSYQLTRDRQRRIVKLVQRLSYADILAYALVVTSDLDNGEPKSYKEVVSYKEKAKWLGAMKEEMESLLKNKTWVLLDKSDNQKLVGCKWIYKKKEGIEGMEQPRYKFKLVAKGFTQKKEVDFNEIFSPVVKQTSIRVLLSLVVVQNFELEQMDVKTVFLHGDLDETICMRQLRGLRVKIKIRYVFSRNHYTS